MPDPLSVRPVASRKEFRRFIDYMYERNAGDPHWVPPLRISEHERLTPKKNPFFEHASVALLLAWRGDRVVGRIAAIDDRLHNETHHDSVAMFGFFEAEDAEAARALLAAVEDWSRTRGRVRVRGPINPSLNESAGLLIDGFDTDPMLMMPHNPPEYASFIESAGYAKVKDLYAWLYQLAEIPPLYVKLAERVRAKHPITVRPLKLAEFTKEVERLRTIYCAAWERNWGFVPPTAAEFRRIATELKPIFDPRGAIYAELDGRPVACLVSVPDINQALKGTSGRLLSMAVPRILLRKRYVSQVRLLLLGVDERYRRMGLFPLLLAEWHRQLMGTEIRRAEFSWVLEDNRDINQPAEAGGARRYKTYRIYEKALA
jgi:GNAT superfamily N-acetyltransferase